MYYKIICILILFLLISINNADQSQMNKADIIKKQYFKHPHNRYIADGNFTKVVKDSLSQNISTVLIGIMFTSRNCQTCIQSQSQLIEILQTFQLEDIPVYRCELSSNTQIAQKFRVKRFPQIHFILKSSRQKKLNSSKLQIYKTNHLLLKESIVQLGKYLKKALLIFKKSAQQLSFMSISDIPNHLNSIILNLQKLNQNDEINTNRLKEILFNQAFNAMPIILLNNFEYQMYSIQSNMQSEIAGSNSIILIKVNINSNKGKYASNNPESYHILKVENDIQQFFRQNSQYSSDPLQLFFKSFLFYSVNQFTQDIFKIQQSIIDQTQDNKYPIVYLAVIDSIWKRTQSILYLRVLNSIIKKFQQNQIIIYWTEGEINSEKKRLLGFQSTDQPPLFGRLILEKSSKKHPLIDLKTNKPIFQQELIKKMIRTDLGYEKLLVEKIQYKLSQMGFNHNIMASSTLHYPQNSKNITFLYCTSDYLHENELLNLNQIQQRFSRFYRQTNMVIMTSPCSFSNRKTLLNNQKLSIIFNKSLYQINLSPFYQINNFSDNFNHIQSEIKIMTDKIAKKQDIPIFIPRLFMVNENKMLAYLQDKYL